MKQHITIDQFNELSEKHKDVLREWNEDCGGIYDIKSLSIGELIAFLSEKELPRFSFNGGNAFDWWGYNFDEAAKSEFHGASVLCDKLWDAVKEVLERE